MTPSPGVGDSRVIQFCTILDKENLTIETMLRNIGANLFLARLHEVHRAIAVTPVVHVPVPVRVPVRVRVRVTLALKFSRSPYLDNHSSESIHTWTIDTL